MRWARSDQPHDSYASPVLKTASRSRSGPARSRSSSQRRLMLRGSTGVPADDANTRP